MPEQAKHRLLRLLRFKIKSQGHAESPIVFPGENGERQYRSPRALHSEFLRFSVGIEDAGNISAGP